MILPKFPLLGSATRSFGSQLRLRMSPAKRKVSVCQADLTLVFFEQVFQGALNFPAKWALEIGEFNDHYRCLRTPAKPGDVVGDLDLGRLQ